MSRKQKAESRSTPPMRKLLCAGRAEGDRSGQTETRRGRRQRLAESPKPARIPSTAGDGYGRKMLQMLGERTFRPRLPGSGSLSGLPENGTLSEGLHESGRNA